MKSFPIFLGIILAALLPAAGCEKRKAGKPRLGEVERLPRVETVVLGKPARLEVTRSYTITVEPLEKVDLCAQVQAGTTGLGGTRGVVKPIPKEIDIGRHVAPGQTLIELDLPDVKAEHDTKSALVTLADNALLQAEQAIKVATAEVKEAQAQLLRYQADIEFKTQKQKRVEDLVTRSVLQPHQKDEADLELKASQAALEAARAQVTTKKERYQATVRERDVAASKQAVAASELKRYDVLVGFLALKAPFPAVITKRWVNTGDTIRDAAMPLLTLQRVDSVRVLIDFPERDVPLVLEDGPASKGNHVRVQIPALGTETFQGSITLKADALDPITRTMRAETHLDNNKGLLKPQMTGTAHVILAARDALTVPSSPLVRTGDKMEIYIVADPAGDPTKGTLKRLEVQTGLDDGLRVEIKGDHLTGRELVVIKGAGVLRPGEQVIAMPARIGE